MSYNKDVEQLRKACLLLAKYLDVVFYPRYVREHKGYEDEPDLDQIQNEVKEVLE